MFNIRKFFEGIGIVPKTTTTADTQGELEVLSSDGKLRYHNGTSVSPVVTESHAGTLTNKTIDADLNTITNIDNADIKAGAAIDAAKIADGSVSNTEFQYLDGVTSNIQNQLDSKSPSGNYITDLTGDVTATGPGSAVATLSNGVVTDSKVAAVANIARTKLASGNNFRILANNGTGVMSENPAITPSRAVTSDVNGQLAASTTTAVELDYVNGVTSSIQTQLDSKASDASLTAHTGASSSVHGVTGSVVGTTDSQTLTNKTLTSPIVDTVVWDDQASTPANPSSGFYKTYFKPDGNLYKLNSLGVEEQVGSGVGGINLITLDSNYLATQKANFDFETTIGTWVAYADAAAVIPVDMTGGTPGTTVTRTTSSPLDGAASGLMDLGTGSSRQGEGMSNLVYIAPGYRGQQVQFIFPYTVTGTYTAQDLRIFAYDVTNSVLLYPSLNSGINAGTDVASATFQLAPNTDQVRVGVHIARTATSSLSMKFDDVQLVPVKLYSPAIINIMSDWTSYTPSFSNFGTVTSIDMKWKRVGNDLYLAGQFNSGTVVAAEARMTLPAGLTIDATKITSLQHRGDLLLDQVSTEAIKIAVEPSQSYVVFTRIAGSGTQLTKINGNNLYSNVKNTISAGPIPITEWTQAVTANIFEAGDFGPTNFVPTIGNLGAYTINTSTQSRNGKYLSLEVSGQAGTVVASPLYIDLPAGLNLDPTVISAGRSYLGLAQGIFTTSTWSSTGFTMSAFYDGLNPNRIFFAYSGSGNSYVKGNGNDLCGNNGGFTISIKVPIQGWSTFPFGVAINNQKVGGFQTTSAVNYFVNTSGIWTTATDAGWASKTFLGNSVSGTDPNALSFKVPHLSSGVYRLSTNITAVSASGNGIKVGIYDGTTRIVQYLDSNLASALDSVPIQGGLFVYATDQFNKEFFIQVSTTSASSGVWTSQADATNVYQFTLQRVGDV